MIPSDIKWDPNATPPQFTDNGDQVIEKGTHLRIKIMGTRSDVGSMFAIGSIKEDFLGFVACPWSYRLPLTNSQDSVKKACLASRDCSAPILPDDTSKIRKPRPPSGISVLTVRVSSVLLEESADVQRDWLGLGFKGPGLDCSLDCGL